MFNATQVIKEGLTIQQEVLVIARDRHLRWAKNTPYPEAAQLHLEIADLFRQSIEKYNTLLDMYQKLVE